MVAEPSLAGFTVAVTARRLAEQQALLFERRAAAVVHVPLVDVQLSSETDAIAAARAAVARPPQIAVFSTGVGTRWWFALVDESGLGEEVRGGLSRAYVVARGPKAQGALTTAGVRVDWRAPRALGDEVLGHLIPRVGRERRVLVQLDGVSTHLAACLARHGADVVAVRAYRTLPEGGAGPSELTRLRAADAVTFTSPVAATGLALLAAAVGEEPTDLLQGAAVVAVGPVTAAALADVGVTGAVAPDDHRLGAMVRTTVDALTAREVPLAGGVVLRGAAVEIHGRTVPLPAGERRLLEVLVRARGAVVPKPVLARHAGVASGDPHAVEAVMTRLRRRLVGAGDLLVTVPRRGYRLAAASAGAGAGAGLSAGRSAGASADAGRSRPSQP